MRHQAVSGQPSLWGDVSRTARVAEGSTSERSAASRRAMASSARAGTAASSSEDEEDP